MNVGPSDVDLVALGGESVAVVALDTTYGLTPALIVECAVLHCGPGTPSPSARPWSFWVQRDVPLHALRPSAWPHMAKAPQWPEVAERVTEAIGDRLVVMHEREQYDVLRAHLPDWEPRGLVITREVARLVWPNLADYRINTGNSATAQALAVFGVLRELLIDAKLPADLRRGAPLTSRDLV